MKKHTLLPTIKEDENGCSGDFRSMLHCLEEKKRRLSIDQVNALEHQFTAESRLDPVRKRRVALELGLQPRQVAVWFQNRRARTKAKQLEKDFLVLKTSYDALKNEYDRAKRENEALTLTVNDLKAKNESSVPSPILNFCGFFSVDQAPTLLWR